MTDFLFQIGLSNACLALALGIVAMVVGVTTKRSHLAYLLWLLVFVKLMTPPMVTIPLITIPDQPETAVAMNDNSRPGSLANSHELSVDAQPTASLWSRIESAGLSHGKEWLAAIWLLGSVTTFAWSMIRMYRFNRLLRVESEVAPQELQTAAVKIGRRLKMKTIPMVYITSAHISPMVWWTGGKVQVVIPTTLLSQMSAKQWQWILAHELAHVRRRDYFVRWLEWLACVCFWWNPVVWWAQRNLRATEEICCDALVVSNLNPRHHTYAESLLTAIECLARPILRTPAMASEIKGGGYLERRFRAIVSGTIDRKTSRWLQACVLLCAMIVLPFGLVSAWNDEIDRPDRQADIAENQITVLNMSEEELALARKFYELKKSIESGRIARVDLAKPLQELGITWSQGNDMLKRAEKEYGQNPFAEDDYDVWEERLSRLIFTEPADIRKVFQNSGLNDEQLEQILYAMDKVVYEVQSEGEDFDLDPGLWNYFKKEVGLTDEQLELVQGIAQRLVHGLRDSKREENERDAGIEGSFRWLGITDRDVKRIRKTLQDNGLNDEQAEQTLGGMLRVVYEMQSEGEDFELDPGLRNYFENTVGLTNEQIELVVGMARRVVPAEAR